MRDSYIDIAKGICMLLIICIHTEVFGVIGMPLTFVAVPMFFFMSGFFDRTETGIDEWMLKSVKTQIVPGIFWLVASNAYLSVLGFVKTGEIVSYRFDLFNPQQGNGPVWFLFALFYVKCLNAILIRLFPKWYLALMVSLGVGYLGSAFQMPLCLDEGMAALPLYYVGKLSYPHLRSIMANWKILTLGTILLCVYLWSPFYYNIGPSNGLFSPCYILAIAGINPIFVLILAMSSRLEFCTWLNKIGLHTLGIMLVHAPMCHTAAVILNRVFVPGSWPWITSFLIAYIIIILVAYHVTLLISRYCPFLFGRFNQIRE